MSLKYSATRSDIVNRPPRRRRSLPDIALLGCLTLTISSCSSAVTLDPAPDAANPDCAPTMVALPETLSGFTQRETTAQATSAWGDPPAVILKCGVSVQKPVTDPCVSVNDVDWIIRPADGSPEDADRTTPSSPAPVTSAAASGAEQPRVSEQPDGTWTATTYGRSPAVQVTFDAGRIASSSLLADLSSAVAQLPQQEQCLSVADDIDDLPRG